MENAQEVECSKCLKKINSVNKKLHEVQCIGVAQHNNLRSQVHCNSINQLLENKFSLLSENKLNPNSNNFNNSNSQNNDISDLFYCNDCNNYLRIEEKQDHEFSHQLDKNENTQLKQEINPNIAKTNSIKVQSAKPFINGSLMENQNSMENIPFKLFSNNHQNIPNLSKHSNNLFANVNNNLNIGMNRSTGELNPNSFFNPNKSLYDSVLNKGENKNFGFYPNSSRINGNSMAQPHDRNSLFNNPFLNPPIINAASRNSEINSSNLFNNSPFVKNHNANFNFPHPTLRNNNFNSNTDNLFMENRILFEENNRRQQNQQINRSNVSRAKGLFNDGFSNIKGLLYAANLNLSNHSENKQTFDNIPEMTINESNKVPEEKDECSICLSNFQIGEKIKIMTCTHLFHTKCIRDWFRKDNTCPICKRSIDL